MKTVSNNIKHSFQYGGAEPKCPMCGVPITRGVTREVDFTMIKVVKDIFINLRMEHLGKPFLLVKTCYNGNCHYRYTFDSLCDCSERTRIVYKADTSEFFVI